MPKERKPTETIEYAFDGDRVYHDIYNENEDDGFAHRLRHGYQIGDWQPYAGIAALGDYHAVTEFYAGVFPTTVFKITVGIRLS